MRKSVYVMLILIIFSTALRAQEVEAAKLKGNIEVSGIVVDTDEKGLKDVVVKLVSTKDTLQVSTNSDGVFLFKKVFQSEFVLTVLSLGFKPYIKKYFFNDSDQIIVLDPIVLGIAAQEIEAVVITYGLYKFKEGSGSNI